MSLLFVTFQKRPTAAAHVEPSREAPPTERNAFAEQKINFKVHFFSIVIIIIVWHWKFYSQIKATIY